MRRRVTTRWYIVAWVLWLLATLIGWRLVIGGTGGGNSPPAGVVIPYGVMAITGLVMLVMWIGALARLGTLHQWSWFVGVLVLHLVALGIIGMVAYAIWGPDNSPDIATRPSFT